MHEPLRTAGFALPRLGSALALSVLTHAGLLGALAYWHLAAEPPASVGQKRGSLSVRLTTTQKANKAPAAQTTSPQTRPPRPILPAKVQPQPAPAPAPQTTAPAPPPADTPTPPPPGPAGASFANLFAPFTNRPLGRGRWGAPPPPTQPPPDIAMQREQAIQALRQAVASRMAQLQARLNEQPLTGPCALRIDLAHQWGEARCADPQDQALVWSYINQLLPANRPSIEDQPICVQVQARELSWSPCPAHTTDTLP